VGWSTLQGALGAWRVHRWRLACFSLVLWDTMDCKDISGQWNYEWPLDTWVDFPIFRWQRETFQPMLVNDPAAYPGPDNDDESWEAQLLEWYRIENALPSTPPPPKAVIFSPLAGRVSHLKWWLNKYLADHVDIFHMSAEMGNNEPTEMQLDIEDSRNDSVFGTAPTVGS